MEPRPVKPRKRHPARRTRRVVGAASVAGLVVMTGTMAANADGTTKDAPRTTSTASKVGTATPATPATPGTTPQGTTSRSSGTQGTTSGRTTTRSARPASPSPRSATRTSGS